MKGGDSARLSEGQTSARPLITVSHYALTAAFRGLEKWTCHSGNSSGLAGCRELTVPEHLAEIRAC